MKRSISRGDINLVDFGDNYGSEQGGVRPALIIQNDIGNYHSTTTLVVPISSKNINRCLPTHVMIDAMELVRGEIKGKAMLEQIRVVDKNRIQKNIGRINERTFCKVHNAMLIATGYIKSQQTKQCAN
ncbi:type II toxin-antitoxin system PemK/MazF family toxin [Halobacillus trueperi]|uniref:mRNA interferase n=1 Tax=Halobacillus trueperi TaxID=156205 RepID=A0A3D8VND0_9BACI|nr:type II toxin-antitoxin system PemK/MazF family toxin [Halobacillus trueperi]RDY70870.1 type II toxin-antitoxin system PemK/MazF family toxin [Halobacillus trueperi]